MFSKSQFYSGDLNSLNTNEIFVFGSNPEGRHGKGSALLARQKFGAKYGQGRGFQGQSYALVTKNLKPSFFEKSTGITYHKFGAKSVSKEQISLNIDDLYQFAIDNPQLTFKVVYQSNSSNLNGYSSDDIFKMFVIDKKIPSNVQFSDTFLPLAQQLSIL